MGKAVSREGMRGLTWKIKNLPVAQLDNATDSDSVDRGFESRRADQKIHTLLVCIFLSIKTGFEADRKENVPAGHF